MNHQHEMNTNRGDQADAWRESQRDGPARPTLARLRSMMGSSTLFTSDAYAVAEKQAHLFLRLADCTEPTDISDAIAGLPRLKIELVENLRSSGSSEWAGGQWLIQIRASEPPVRQRFTLAHELKHIIDHPLARTARGFGLSDQQRQHLGLVSGRST